MTHDDVIIVGGGLVGSTLACALGQHGLSIAVVEAKQAPVAWSLNGYDLRVSAITHATKRILTNLQVWQKLPEERVTAFQNMRVWDAQGDGEIDFDSGDVSEATLGYIIENRELLSALRQTLQRLDNVKIVCPAECTALQVDADAAILNLVDGQELTASLLIGADGARSWVREQLQIDLSTWSYHQHAIVTYVETEQVHQATAWQRFLPTGPLAFLPLSDPHWCSIVWTQTPQQAQHLVSLTDQAFQSQLGVAFDWRLGKVLSVGPRVQFPLAMRHAKQYVCQRAALVGDSAHTIHPLAGQGVNLGILDAASLAASVAEALASQRDIGSERCLRRYERWRKAHNIEMIAAMEVFKRLFCNRSITLGILRNVGLNVVNQFDAFKVLAARHAMGLTGDLPPLASH